MQVSEAFGNGGNGGGHPDAADKGRRDPAQGHACRHDGDGEEHRLPTDVRLRQKSRTLRTFVRVSKKVVLLVAKFGRNKKDLVEKATKKLLSMRKHTLRRVAGVGREIGKRLRSPAVRTKLSVRRTLIRIRERLRQEVEILEQILVQTTNRLKERPTEKRIYSVHEPEVTCITKNKAGKRHEYGVKVALAVADNGMVVTHSEYADNRYNGSTLSDSLKGWEVFP